MPATKCKFADTDNFCVMFVQVGHIDNPTGCSISGFCLQSKKCSDFEQAEIPSPEIAIAPAYIGDRNFYGY